jgi:hypothetical protein
VSYGKKLRRYEGLKRCFTGASVDAAQSAHLVDGERQTRHFEILGADAFQSLVVRDHAITER